MNHLPIPRAQSTTDLIDPARHEQEVEKIKAAFFDSMMKALTLGTGEYKKIKKKARAYYETEARERLAIRRENNGT